MKGFLDVRYGTRDDSAWAEFSWEGNDDVTDFFNSLQGVAVAYAINNYVVLGPAIWWSCRRGPVSTYDLFTAAIPHFVSTCLSGLTMVAIWRTICSPGLFLLCSARDAELFNLRPCPDFLSRKAPDLV